MGNDDYITIDVTRFKKLEEKERKLEALFACGVDNWSGYDDAMELLEEWGNE